MNRLARSTLLTAALAGCAAPVVVDHAPFAADPVCGVVLQRAPVTVDGLTRRTTTSQGSRAWGDGGQVVLRCGVEPRGPSTEQCVRITGSGGRPVDWVAMKVDGGWVFVTYGRRPAVEVVVRPDRRSPSAGDGEGPVLSDQPTAVLVDLAPAVAATAVERTCL